MNEVVAAGGTAAGGVVVRGSWGHEPAAGKGLALVLWIWSFTIPGPRSAEKYVAGTTMNGKIATGAVESDMLRRWPLVGRCQAVERLRELIATVARHQCSLLVQGESGTGKEVVARHIHHYSARSDGPFVPVDCTTLRDTLLESQLFGHRRGAFTGADRDTIGFVRAADGGTLFLDEVGELDPVVQAKLLRCIQEQAVVPLGDTRPVPVDVRVIAATHRNLQDMVDTGSFREDLYFRLNVVRIGVPPLRERRDDIALLADHFLARLARADGTEAKRLSSRALAVMQLHGWPGNVRELGNTIEHAFVMSQGDVVDVGDLPVAVRRARPARHEPVGHEGSNGSGDEPRAGAADETDVIEPLEVMQERLVCAALKATNGHQGRAAELLQIERRRLYRLVKRYGLRDLTHRSSSATLATDNA